MQKIANKYIKIDLHIHTSASSKDGPIVSGNTVEMIDKTLIPSLVENEVEMVALTDHNTFSIEHYNKLKEYENKELKKVLPGIEFDVRKHKSRFHVVVIFDDTDYEKIKSIKKVISIYNKHFTNGAYDFPTFIKILDDIKIPCVTIVHQKSDPKGGDHNTDLSIVGYENFLDELYIDYFDSLEFAARDNEGFLKLRKVEDNIENLRYITGTDCHNWEEYPKKDDKFPYTYIKSLPTFMGLVMALTEFNRVKIDVGHMQNPILKNIEYTSGGKENKIELANGINVIIGDNSIGKSAILEQLFSENTMKYHRDYLKKHKLEFKSLRNDSIKTIYNKQGEIRSKFSKNGNKLEDDDSLKENFTAINTQFYENSINGAISKLIEYYIKVQEYKKSKQGLNTTIDIPRDDRNSKYPTFEKIGLEKNTVLDDKIIELNLIIESLNKVIKLEKNDAIVDELKAAISIIENINKKYLVEKRHNEILDIIANQFNNIADNQNELIRQLRSDLETQIDSFNNSSSNIIGLFKKHLIEYSAGVNHKKIDDIKIEISPNLVGSYEFYSDVEKRIFKQSDLENALMNAVDKTKVKKFEDTLQYGLDDLELNGFNNSDASKKDYLELKLKEYVKVNYLKKKNYITKNEEKMSTAGYSAGKNALIYLDILKKYESVKVIVLDQPEDDVSQNKISSELIDILNFARKYKQIIFITHNPQLVVNLDVDNVIFMEYEENNIKVNYGALEYISDEFNMLEKIAEMLDGGKETIRKRWRRYGK